MTPRLAAGPKARPNPRRAFFFLDALVGLALVGILASLLAVTLTHLSRANARLADSRAATRLAERTLLTLQSSLPADPLPEGARLTLTKLPDQAGPRLWVRLDASVNNRPATLYALLPAPVADHASQLYPEESHP